jgi:hypothetical protein
LSRIYEAWEGRTVMGRGASFNLQPCRNPAGAVAHNLRQWTDQYPRPDYMLPEPHGGHHSVIDGDVPATHAAKLAMASRQARQDPKFSPVWEGVLNLDPDLPPEEQDEAVRAFVDAYEAITGHKVISAQVHLDEGQPGPPPKINGHAHIFVDRTDDKGKAILLKPEQLRRVQDAAADATGLERGQPVEQTGRQRLDHTAYRKAARAGLVESQSDRAQTQDALVAAGQMLPALAKAQRAVETAQLYGELRGLLKASGTAKQADYSEAKKHAEDPDWLLQQIQKLEAQAAAKALAEAEAAETAKAAERAKMWGLGEGIAAAAQGDIALVWASKGAIIYKNSEVRERLEKIIAPATKILIGWVKKFAPQRVWEGPRAPTQEEIEEAFKRRPFILGGPVPVPPPDHRAPAPEPLIVRAAPVSKPVLKPRRRPQFER